MSILIICESHFGNTRSVAAAIAEGLSPTSAPAGSGEDVRVLHPREAPVEIPDDVRLLVVGGPTHAFSMSREVTRGDALRQGGQGDPEDIGIREWVEQVTPREDLPVRTFDTRLDVKLLPGSAAKQAARILLQRGFALAAQGESFWVTETTGPISDDELERARQWGATLRGTLA